MSKPGSANNSPSINSTERDSLINKSNASTPPADEQDKDSSILIFAFAAMLVFQLGNRIFGKLMCYPMHNYALFMSMVSAFIYVPLCFAYVIPARIYTKNITDEQINIPKYKFAVMGMFDSVAGLMSSFAVNYISSASLIVLIGQSAIPISMAISYYLLQARYSISQYTGAGIVLLGIAVVLLPSFLTPAIVPNANSTPDSSSTSSSSNNEVMWICILVLSCVPMCLSSAYKEKVCI
jgi:drug/metabolite transporter (DMT)-like permease